MYCVPYIINIKSVIIPITSWCKTSHSSLNDNPSKTDELGNYYDAGQTCYVTVKVFKAISFCKRQWLFHIQNSYSIQTILHTSNQTYSMNAFDFMWIRLYFFEYEHEFISPEDSERIFATSKMSGTAHARAGSSSLARLSAHLLYGTSANEPSHTNEKPH